jgi:hypothetical protein
MELIGTSILALLVIMTGFLVYREKYPSSVVIKDPPILKLEQGKPIALTGVPANIALTGAPKDIPVIGFPRDIPLSGVPKSIEMTAPSSIPLRAEPLLVNYGNAPQLKLADIPPLKFENPSPILIRNNPCEGLSGKFRGVGPECARFIWQDSGCVEGRRAYTEWDKKRTKDELYADYGAWASLKSAIHREGCYGPNWDEYTSNPPETFILMGPSGQYMPPGYWDSILAEKGWQKATPEQLNDAHKAGAEWCASGALASGPNKWPMQTAKQGCGGPGIATWTPSDGSGGVTIFASKPPRSKAKTDKYTVVPFNTADNRWSVFN